MEQILIILSYPFIQRALLGGILVAVLTSFVGILAVLRRSSMVGDTVAHASLAGVALGLLIGWNPILTAAVIAVVISLSLPPLTRYSKLPIDSILGFVLPFAMAFGVILLSIIPGYQPELVSFLFGSILSISWANVATIAVLVLIVSISLFFLHEKLLFVSFDEVYAKTAGIKVGRINALYSIILALTIVVGIQLVGIVLLNALLVIPASTVRLMSRSLKDMFWYTPVVSVLVVIMGIFISFFIDIPTGPTIAVVSGAMFIFVISVKKLLWE